MTLGIGGFLGRALILGQFFKTPNILSVFEALARHFNAGSK